MLGKRTSMLVEQAKPLIAMPTVLFDSGRIPGPRTYCGLVDVTGLRASDRVIITVQVSLQPDGDLHDVMSMTLGAKDAPVLVIPQTTTHGRFAITAQTESGVPRILTYAVYWS